MIVFMFFLGPVGLKWSSGGCECECRGETHFPSLQSTSFTCTQLTLSLSLMHEPSPFSTVQFEAQVVQNCDETVANLNGHIDSGLLKATLKTTERRGNVCYNIRLNV